MREHKRPSQHMIDRGRELRQASTRAEQTLWAALRGRKVAGLKFRRQQAIGRFVADFYCAAARVVIELDGDSHALRRAEDHERQVYLERRGLKVIRFDDADVLTNPEWVVNQIVQVCTPRMAPSPLPSPFKGEGEGRV